MWDSCTILHNNEVMNMMTLGWMWYIQYTPVWCWLNKCSRIISPSASNSTIWHLYNNWNMAGTGNLFKAFIHGFFACEFFCLHCVSIDSVSHLWSLVNGYNKTWVNLRSNNASQECKGIWAQPCRVENILQPVFTCRVAWNKRMWNLH